MGPFRDDHADSTRFAQHIAVAEDALDRVADVLRRIKAGDGFTPDELTQLVRDVRVGWENVWDHLEQARAIAAAKRRDLTAYNEARAAAGDIWNDIVSDEPLIGRVVDVTLRVPLDYARLAVAALRAAMPEVVVAQRAPLDVDLSTRSGKVLKHTYTIIAVAVLAYIAYEFMF